MTLAHNFFEFNGGYQTAPDHHSENVEFPLHEHRGHFLQRDAATPAGMGLVLPGSAGPPAQMSNHQLGNDNDNCDYENHQTWKGKNMLIEWE